MVQVDSPLQAYRQAVSAGEIQHDEAQRLVVDHLQQLFDELVEPPKESGWLSRLKQRFNNIATRPIRGLYLWGGVGRGKTFLMDLFYDALPFEEKSRMHFHRFMRTVHKQLNELQGEKNPLEKVAEQFASQARIICFDEFFVSDITDAMLLATLLDELFRRQVVLVATSNVAPCNLYKDGLQRRQFLPAIDLLEKNTRVVNVDGGTDYRLRVLEKARLYHSPLDDAADISLGESFLAIAPDETRHAAGQVSDIDDKELELEGRKLNVRRCGDGVVWFDFGELCDGPRSQNDYMELARIYQTVLVSGVPQFDSAQEDQARRFISLIDEFYDRNVKIIISAEVPIPLLYQGVRLDFEFKRTESRLHEMQSHEYLAREHKP